MTRNGVEAGDMSDVVRFSVSLEGELLEAFDRYCQEGKLATRSEAIRQLLREKLTTVAWQQDAANVAASLTLVYDHHHTRLTDRMLELQHAHADMVVATLHVHLDHDLCLELIALRGPAIQLQTLASKLSGLKGIHQAQLVIARAEPPETNHKHPHIHSGKPHKH